MNPESKFSGWLTSTVFKHADCQRIETTTGSGVPDLNIFWNRHEFWIETKICTPRGEILLRPYQWAWIKRRTKMGGKVYVFGESGDSVRIWSGKTLRTEFIGSFMASCVEPDLVLRKKSAIAQRFLEFIDSETF